MQVTHSIGPVGDDLVPLLLAAIGKPQAERAVMAAIEAVGR
jgi:hypothetical protein